jgi:hypothetical protein
MSYKKFTLTKLKSQFNIQVQKQSLFSGIEIEEIAPSAWLEETLNLAKIIAVNSEKAKSELIIMPILAEITKRNSDKVSLYSGVMLNADAKLGLNGECDFVFSNKAHSYFLESPVIALVEAKNDNVDYGLPQCIAQMLGASVFNQAQSLNIPTIYGCVTTGNDWLFLKQQGQDIFIDDQRYYLHDIGNLLGIFQHIVNLYSEKNT